jgi:signal transduction histidine kinase
MARMESPSGGTDSYHHRAGERPACFRLRSTPLVAGKSSAAGEVIAVCEITAEVLLIREFDRQQQAGYLHDEVGQMLSACLMHLARIGRDVGGTGVLERLDAVVDLLEETLQGVRARMCDVAPRLLQEQSLAASLRCLASHFADAVQVPIEVDACSALPPVPFITKLILIGSVRTVLLHALAHSSPQHVRIRCEWHEGEVAVVIWPDAAGMEAVGTEPDWNANGGSCAMGVWEYVRWGGGSVCRVSASAGGSGLRISLPVPALAADVE